jgi:ADP-glucose pyrophosphorylase
MTTNTQSSYLAELHAAHKARQARIALAAMKVREEQKQECRIIDVSESGRRLAERRRAAAEGVAKQKALEERRRIAAKERWRASWRYMVELAGSNQSERNAISLRQIMEQTAAKYGVTVHDLKSNRRTRGALMQARFEVCWRAKTETYCSYPQIGRALNRDHTSAIHAVKHYERMRAEAMGGPPAYKLLSGKYVLRDLIMKGAAE